MGVTEGVQGGPSTREVSELDIDTTLKDGILGGALEPVGATAGNDGKQSMELCRMMDELDAAAGDDGGGDEAVPVVFICPISLEPMVDPVTLCMGQMYERANISRWLALGHRTCPTTMQELWDDALTTQRHPPAAHRRLVLPPPPRHDNAQKAALKGQARVAALRELRTLAASHQSVIKAIAKAGCVALLMSLLGPFTSLAVGTEVVAISSAGCCLTLTQRPRSMQPWWQRD
ncbi:U-box domain-containing protein 31 [Zea mays]|nr:U-box domain-containing protein 31 [Zea mays]